MGGSYKKIFHKVYSDNIICLDKFSLAYQLFKS